MFRLSKLVTQTPKCCRNSLLKLIVQQNKANGFNFINSARLVSSAIDTLFPSHHVFAERHIGPNEDEKQAMLEFIGMEVCYICHFCLSVYMS